MAVAKKKTTKERYVIGYDEDNVFFEPMTTKYFPSEKEALLEAEELASGEDVIVILKVVKRYKIKRMYELQETN